jgi:hypothetical protein
MVVGVRAGSGDAGVAGELVEAASASAFAGALLVDKSTVTLRVCSGVDAGRFIGSAAGGAAG